MRFLFSRGQAKHSRPGSERFRIAHVYEYAPCFDREQTTQAYSGLYASSAGEVCPFAAESAGDFVFIWGRRSPARKAGMTGTHLRMSQAGNAGIQSFPLFYFAQTPRGFVDKSKNERRSDMKYHAIWKPGGRPRNGMGSMKPKRRQLQALKPRGTIPGEGAANRGETAGKAA